MLQDRVSARIAVAHSSTSEYHQFHITLAVLSVIFGDIKQYTNLLTAKQSLVSIWVHYY